MTAVVENLQAGPGYGIIIPTANPNDSAMRYCVELQITI